MTILPVNKKSILVMLAALLVVASSAASLAILGGRGFSFMDKVATTVKVGNEEDGKKSSVFKEVAKPIYLAPIQIQFKDKVLDVEEIGVEDGGFLAVPLTWQTAGWYKEGAKPGEEGNVIIDGHYDTNTGAPGAFWELKDLQVGDRVLLTDKLGRVFAYSVNAKSFISITDPERSKVFASGKDRVLTLITCGGVWDYGSNTYSKRLVITAVFDKMEKTW